MSKRLLVPFDGSEHAWSALQQAIWIAQKEEGSVICGLHVVDLGRIESLYVPSAIAGYGAWSGVEYFGQLQQDMEDAGRQILAELEDRCRQSGVLCQTDLATGVVDRVIVQKAEEGIDMVIMGHRGTRAAWAGFLLGSVFESVVRHAKPPVMACLRDPRPINKLLAAYDGSRNAKDALETAAKLAKDWELPLAVLAVEEPSRVTRAKLEEARQLAAHYGLSADLLWRQGRPGDEILRTAESEGCDLIVMGVTGHGVLSQALFGSTVDAVVHRSRLPVLICH